MYFNDLIHLTIIKDNLNLGYNYYKHDALNKLLSTLMMDLVFHIKSTDIQVTICLNDNLDNINYTYSKTQHRFK